MVIRRLFLLSAVVPAVALLAGCSDEFAGREAISGTVTLKGEPLKDGSIQFEPLSNQGTNGGAGVADGKFAIDRQYGLKPGKYLVRITSGDGQTPSAAVESGEAPGPTGPVPGKKGNANIISFDLIPADWAENSKHEIEVKAGQKNDFTFEIPNIRSGAKKK